MLRPIDSPGRDVKFEHACVMLNVRAQQHGVTSIGRTGFRL
jgi:hypothetical protein